MIVFICGKGGSGKDTVCHRLLENVDNLERLPQYTTRPKRDSDSDDAYIFMTYDDFLYEHLSGNLVEHRVYRVADDKRWYYGTPKDLDLDDSKIYLSWGPTEMLANLKIGLDTGIVSILLDIDVKTSLERMLLRCGESSKDIVESCRRVVADEYDFKGYDNFSYKIDATQSIDDVYNQVHEIIKGTVG